MMIVMLYLYVLYYRNEQRKLQEKLKSVESKLIVGGVNLVIMSSMIKDISTYKLKLNLEEKNYKFTNSLLEKEKSIINHV